MGDRIAVMRAGKILQLGDPLYIYQTPIDRFVGGFIGNPPMNFIAASIAQQGDGLIAGVQGAGSFKADGDAPDELKGYVGKPVTVGIRAENIEVRREPTEGDTLKARVLVVEPLGSHDLLTCQLGSELIKVATRPDMAVKADEDVHLALEHERTVWLDPETERTIGM